VEGSLLSKPGSGNPPKSPPLEDADEDDDGVL
jgi:hypothetical protein